MRWTVSALLRPVAFVLAIVAAVLTGNRSGSFWYGLLAFLVATGAGRVLRALVRGRPGAALYRAVWPAAATGFAFLFAAIGLPAWASFLVSLVAASLTRNAVGGLVPGRRRRLVRGEWKLSDLDELLP